MQFSSDWFNSHLENMGQDMLWRVSSMCPCVNPNSGAAKHNCPVCSGKGRSWAAPVKVKAGLASEKVLRAWAQFGQWTSGDAVISVPENSPMYDAGQFDRITMLNAVDRFSLVLTRGLNDRVSFQARKIQRVFWLNSQSQVVEGGIPAVDGAGNLTWTAGAPPAGMQYTVTGERYSEYFIYDDIPGDRNHHYGARLPRKIVARRFDLFGR